MDSKSKAIIGKFTEKPFTFARLFVYNGPVKNSISWLKISFIMALGFGAGALGAYLWDLHELKGLLAASESVDDGVQTEVRVEAPTLEEAFPYVLPPKSTLNSVFRELGVSPQSIHQIVEAAKPINDLGRLHAGTRFQLTYLPGSQNEVIGVRFRFSHVEQLEVKKNGDTWLAEKNIEAVDIKIRTFTGIVKSSLWESATQAKMDPNLISDLSEVFAWQIDFSREVRVRDRWRISVEQKWVKGQPIGWGSILAAEYETADQKYSAILFDVGDGERGYFAPDGTSLKKMFLKSPLRFGRISSRFTTKRFHPILQINRPHLGVDYAAPIGTPIRAIGDGVISEAGWRGTAGNMIRLRHNSIYMTAYKHLKGFAKGIRSGSRVAQGQVIGYVGNTGLSSGPHLHFEFFQSGRFVDPLGKKFPSADPVPQALMGQFEAQRKNLVSSLPLWDSVKVGSVDDEKSTL